MKKNVDVKAYRTMFDLSNPKDDGHGKVTYPPMLDSDNKPIKKTVTGKTVEIERGDIPDEYLQPFADELKISIDALIDDLNARGIRLGTQKRLAEKIGDAAGQPSLAMMKEALGKVAKENNDWDLMQTVVLGKKEAIAKLYLEHCV